MKHEKFKSSTASDGGAMMKSKESREALDRQLGLSEAMSAMASRTRSGHPATKTNNLYTAPELGWGEGNHVVGYSEGCSY